LSEKFDSYYKQLRELNDKYLNGEYEDLEDKIDYLIDKSFLLQHLIMQEDIDRVNQGTELLERTRNAISSVSEMQDGIQEVLKHQDEIEYLLRKKGYFR